MDNFIR